MTRVLFHVDMDAFFASVEVRERPELRGKPVLVGGDGKRGVVAAASYEARRFGCHSAQPMAVARRRCPEAVVVSPRHTLYTAASAEIFATFSTFSPCVEELSIDEAFLDMTGTRRLHGSPVAAAEALRRAVYEQTKLTCSVGIAAIKFLAKIASGHNKPDGITVVPPGEERSFLEPLPVAALWGIGPQTQKRLRSRGIETIGDLARREQQELERWFGKHGTHLYRLSHAIDERDVVPGHDIKSISHEDTYEDDIVSVTQLHHRLLSQATRVADRLVRKDLRGRIVRLKIRDSQFTTETRQCTLQQPTQQAKVIYRAARQLLASVETQGRGFRLTGVGVAALESDTDQLQLEFVSATSQSDRDATLQTVMTQVRTRYGQGALYPADAQPSARTSATGAVSSTLDRDPALDPKP